MYSSPLSPVPSNSKKKSLTKKKVYQKKLSHTQKKLRKNPKFFLKNIKKKFLSWNMISMENMEEPQLFSKCWLLSYFNEKTKQT